MRLAVTPLGKPRMTQRNKWYTPPAIARYWAYTNTLKTLLPGYTLPVVLNIVFYIPMPASWSKQKRTAKVGTTHDQTPDIDNLAKGFMDAVKSDGRDDKFVAILHASKYWAEEGGIELSI